MMDKEKIVDYAFERDEKLNVLAIHPTRPLIAYLINIQRTPKITKGWGAGNDSLQAITNGIKSSSLNTSGNSSANSSINALLNNSSSAGSNSANQSIRIIDYDTRQRCLAKGVYHARPADCVFTINSLLCSQADIIKFAVVDRAANIYLYDLAYLINGLTATRIAVIRGPLQDVSPYESIVLVWCPFVPCEDFEDGDGGLRLALATNSRIELFAIDRLQGKTGELQRSDLKGAYKCIQDSLETNIVTLSISPDCSTISAASFDNRVTFYSSDIEDSGQRCLHNWTASVTDKNPISKLFFLDDYPRLLADSTMKFWGAAFIGTRGGQMILVNLRNWTVYQRINIHTDSSMTKNFDYRIDSTSRNVVAMNGNQCYVIQIEHKHATTSSSSPSTKGITKQSSGPSSIIDASMPTDAASILEMLNNGDGNIYSFNSSTKSTSNMSHRDKNHPRSSSKSGNYKHHNHQQYSNKNSSNNGSVNQNNSVTDDENLIGLPKIVRTTRINLHNPIYSFVIKQASEGELQLFTISAYSLERYTINLSSLVDENVEENPLIVAPPKCVNPLEKLMSTTTAPVIISSGPPPTTTSGSPTTNAGSSEKGISSGSVNVNHQFDTAKMDRMVEGLFNKLNTTFHQGLEEFLSEIKCEMNDLNMKVSGLSRDVRKLHQQLQEVSRHNKLDY